jgi:hypothetical protein
MIGAFRLDRFNLPDIERGQLLDSGRRDTADVRLLQAIDLPILPELRSIFIKTVGLADELRKALLPEESSIQIAFIFGSFATGDFTSESDVDIFIIGDVSLRRIVSILSPVPIGREINPIVVPADEFCSRVETGDHFYSSVLSSQKIYLIGNDDELTKLAGFRITDRAADITE